MNTRVSLSLTALAAFGLLACTPAFAQVFGESEPDAGEVVIRNVRVLSPEVSRSLKLARTPLPPSPLLVGSYWSCLKHSSGHEICRIKLVVCTDDQQSCVEI